MSPALQQAACAHRRVLAVEKHCPGERVIAGPFVVEHALPHIRREERLLAARALKTQQDAHPKARLVVSGVYAYVLRPEKGWVKQGKCGKPVAVAAKKGGLKHEN